MSHFINKDREKSLNNQNFFFLKVNCYGLIFLIISYLLSTKKIKKIIILGSSGGISSKIVESCRKSEYKILGVDFKSDKSYTDYVDYLTSYAMISLILGWFKINEMTLVTDN